MENHRGEEFPLLAIKKMQKGYDLRTRIEWGLERICVKPYKDNSSIVLIELKMDSGTSPGVVYYSESPSNIILTAHLLYDFQGPVSIQLNAPISEARQIEMEHTSKAKYALKKHVERLELMKNYNKSPDLENVRKFYRELVASLPHMRL